MYQTQDRIELGPSSLLWRYAGDRRIAFMGGTIGLLQLMHPAIGAGVLEHSEFFDDPYGRVFRSLPRILAVVYAGPRAEATGHEVRSFHRDIKGVDAAGRRYHALDPETFWWAHATFQFMAEQVVDRFDHRRLTRGKREQLYREGVEWYRRYGVSDRCVPTTRAQFGETWDRYCDEVLEMNPAVEWVLDTILRARRPPSLPRPLHWVEPIVAVKLVRRTLFVPVRLSAIGGVPHSVRRRFDIPWSRADQAALSALELTVKTAWPALPTWARLGPEAAKGYRNSPRPRAA